MFIEERIPECIRFDVGYEDEYAVEITETGGSDTVRASEYRKLVHPYPRRHFTSVAYQLDRDELYQKVDSLYHRCYGKFAGFRMKHLDDFTTAANDRDPPSATDYPLLLVSAGVYQLRKRYGREKTALPIGWPERIIYKPVAGTVKVGAAGYALGSSAFNVDTTTGLVTFTANKTKAITGITQAAAAVVNVAGHTFVVNDSVQFSSVVGMTQINGLRGVVVSFTTNTITVNINTTGFSTYTSGGVANTAPQVGEAITGGCEFDYPVRFNSTHSIVANHATSRYLTFELIELLNPGQ